MYNEAYMRQAIREAGKASKQNEVPVGAVAVLDGKIIARAHNKKEKKNNAVCHAEIEVLTKAARKLKNWYLENVEIYVTLEPCIMCLGAMVNARIKALYFGAYDKKFPTVNKLENILREQNHIFEISGGNLESECGIILTEYFKGKR